MFGRRRCDHRHYTNTRRRKGQLPSTSVALCFILRKSVPENASHIYGCFFHSTTETDEIEENYEVNGGKLQRLKSRILISCRLEVSRSRMDIVCFATSRPAIIITGSLTVADPLQFSEERKSPAMRKQVSSSAGTQISVGETESYSVAMIHRWTRQLPQKRKLLTARLTGDSAGSCKYCGGYLTWYLGVSYSVGPLTAPPIRPARVKIRAACNCKVNRQLS